MSSRAAISPSCRWSEAAPSSSPSSSGGGSCTWSRTRSGEARRRRSTSSSSSATEATTLSRGPSAWGRSTSSPRSSRRRSTGSARRRGSRRSTPRPIRSPSLRSTSARRRTVRRRKFNPAIQDLTIRQAIAYTIDRERNNEIANQGTSFVAHGLLPSFYADFYEVPEQDYPLDSSWRTRLLDDAGWELNADGIREKDGMVASFDLFVRSEAPAEIQYAKLSPSRPRRSASSSTSRSSAPTSSPS